MHANISRANHRTLLQPPKNLTTRKKKKEPPQKKESQHHIPRRNGDRKTLQKTEREPPPLPKGIIEAYRRRTGELVGEKIDRTKKKLDRIPPKTHVRGSSRRKRCRNMKTESHPPRKIKQKERPHTSISLTMEKLREGARATYFKYSLAGDIIARSGTWPPRRKTGCKGYREYSILGKRREKEKSASASKGRMMGRDTAQVDEVREDVSMMKRSAA